MARVRLIARSSLERRHLGTDIPEALDTKIGIEAP